MNDIYETNMHQFNSLTNPKISVLMCAHNEGKFIAESIESILNQTFTDFEFIIVDDGSADNTWEIIKKYSSSDSRIVALRNQVNHGFVKSLNKGLVATRGKYIARMDADDISYKTRFALQYEFLEQNPEVFLVTGGADIVDENKKLLTKMIPIIDEKKLFDRFMVKNPLIHPSIMFRNEKGLFYREKMVHTEDYDFFLRLLSANKRIVNLPNSLLMVRIKKGSVSDRNRARQRLIAEKAREFYHQRVTTGADEYETFDPDSILELDIKTSDDKLVLESNIRSTFFLEDMSETRRYCELYFRKYGHLNKFIFVYVATLYPASIVRFVVKHSPTSLLRYMNN